MRIHQGVFGVVSLLCTLAAGRDADAQTSTASALVPMTRVEEPYDGGPVPLGASVERRNRVGLIVGGSVLLGVGYVYGAMFCGLLGLVPIVGPALRIPYMVSNRDSISIALIALPSLVMQATGLGLLLGGTIGGPRVLVRNVPSSRPNALSWRLSPGAPQTTFGISVSGVF